LRISKKESFSNEMEEIQLVIFITTRHQDKAKILGGEEQQWGWGI